MTTNRHELHAILQEAYDEHGTRQDEAIRESLRQIDAEEEEDVPFEQVMAELDAKIEAARARAPRKETAEHISLEEIGQRMEKSRFVETLDAIRADFPAAQVLDTRTLPLSITPTSVFALYVAARRSPSLEAFETTAAAIEETCELTGVPTL